MEQLWFQHWKERVALGGQPRTGVPHLSKALWTVMCQSLGKALMKNPAGACATKLSIRCQTPLSFMCFSTSLLLLSSNPCPALPAWGRGCLFICEQRNTHGKNKVRRGFTSGLAQESPSIPSRSCQLGLVVYSHHTGTLQCMLLV